MKIKKSIIGICLAGAIGLFACTDDDSTWGTNSVGDITIEGLTDRAVVSYVGNRVEVKPVLKTGYPEEELGYAWYLYENVMGELDDGYRTNKISEEKDLSYEVNLPSGSYTLVFEVTAESNGYVQTATMNLSVSTSFSQGFYILKETPEGNTEVDLYGNDGLVSNLMARFSDGALRGKPRNLSVVYSGEYIDPDANATASTNLVHVFTEENVYRGFRSEDMKQVFSNSNLFYGGDMPAGEMPYILFRTPNYTTYFSNTGIRTARTASYGQAANTGMMGYPVDEVGTSKHVQLLFYGMNLVYWSDELHRLRTIDYQFRTPADVECNDETAYPDDLECISSGVNIMGNGDVVTAYFLCEQPSSGDRYLLLVDTFSPESVSETIKLDPKFHIASADVVTGNRMTATYLYSIYENELYAYSWTTKDERKFNLPGIPAGETVTYITNQYFNAYMDTSTNFDSFIVATQSGNRYNLYFFDEEDMSGGQPIAPGEVVSGEGTVKAVRFLSSITLAGSDHMDNPLYPLTD